MGGPCCSRLRLSSGLLKGLMMFGLGFCLRSLLDLAVPLIPPTQCPSCASCDQATEHQILKHEIHTQLREPFKANNIFEVIRYDYFNMSTILNNFDDDPKTGLLGHQKSDIKDILQQAMGLFNSARKSPWKMDKLLNGYRRVDPLRGEEYVLDVSLEPSAGQQATKEAHRLELVKPFDPVQLISEQGIPDQHKTVHFILPVTTSNTKLESFLTNFEEVCLEQENSEIFLLIVLFVNSNKGMDPRVNAVKEMTASLSRKYKHAHTSIVQTRKPFSRALGIDLGVKQLPHNVLMFFCDVDVQIAPGFTSRCKWNTILNKQVFYPIVFAQYDPKIVEKYSPQEKYHSLMDINKYTGHWVHYGFGMACMYAGDYRTVGGFDLKISGWGGEDVDLYLKHIKSPLKVFRAADPGLVHVYHPKNCDPSLSADQLRMCLDSKAEGLGSRQQLSKLLQDPNIVA